MTRLRFLIETEAPSEVLVLLAELLAEQPVVALRIYPESLPPVEYSGRFVGAQEVFSP